MLRRWCYALDLAETTHQPWPLFSQIYHEWLSESGRIATREAAYAYGGHIWQIRVVNHVYRRIGLQVRMASGVQYVADHTHACPAGAFMARLLQTVGHPIAERVL